MYKLVVAGTLTALGITGWQHAPSEPPLELKEERITIEYTATANEAVVIVEAEAEHAVESVEVLAPRGACLLETAVGGGKTLALQGFVVETRETSYGLLLQTFEPGTYALRGTTVDGHPLRGSAVLSHELPDVPIVTYPTEGAKTSPTLTVTWMPDPLAVEYRVVVEQGDSDGLAARLPAGTESFRVPKGILDPGTESHVEVGAVGPNGNCTLVEVAFTTR